jgi:hypothetical protein
LFDDATEELRVVGLLDDMAAGGREKDESMPRARTTGLAWISEDGAGVGSPVGGMAENANWAEGDFGISYNVVGYSSKTPRAMRRGDARSKE